MYSPFTKMELGESKVSVTFPTWPTGIFTLSEIFYSFRQISNISCWNENNKSFSTHYNDFTYHIYLFLPYSFKHPPSKYEKLENNWNQCWVAFREQLYQLHMEMLKVGYKYQKNGLKSFHLTLKALKTGTFQKISLEQTQHIFFQSLTLEV